MLGEVKLGHKRNEPPSPEVSEVKKYMFLFAMYSPGRKVGRCEGNKRNI